MAKPSDSTKTIGMYRSVITCDTCTRLRSSHILRDNEFNLPQPGYVGKNYGSTRVLLLGQNPGTSNDKFSDQDKRYARALRKIADEQSSESVDELTVLLTNIIPSWPVTRHFPLRECGLTLDDVACCNVVRCRTCLKKNGNANAPGTAMINNCMLHMADWLDWLQPKVVVCVGKWALEKTEALFGRRGIPCCFINRMRNLSSQQRQQNLQHVMQTVTGALDGDVRTPQIQIKNKEPNTSERAVIRSTATVPKGPAAAKAGDARRAVGSGVEVAVTPLTATQSRIDVYWNGTLIGEYEKSKENHIDRKIDEIRAARDFLIAIYRKHGEWQVRWDGIKKKKSVRVSGVEVSEIPRSFWRG